MFFRRVFWFFQQKQSVYDFSNDELLAILGEAKRHSERDWLMMCVAYNHGLRVAELAGKKAFPVKTWPTEGFTSSARSVANCAFIRLWRTPIRS